MSKKLKTKVSAFLLFLQFTFSFILPLQSAMVMAMTEESSVATFRKDQATVVASNLQTAKYKYFFKSADGATQAAEGQSTDGNATLNLKSQSGEDEIVYNADRLVLKTDSKTYFLEITENSASIAQEFASQSLDLSSDDQNFLANSWTVNADQRIATTSSQVVANQAYRFPLNQDVQVSFSKLPASTSALTIKEVKLSAEQQVSLGAISDVAYDITTAMKDGEFAFDLKLPASSFALQSQDGLEVKFAETVAELGSAKTSTNELVVGDKEVTIKNLDHMTIFVVVNPLPVGVSASFLASPKYVRQNNGTDLVAQVQVSNAVTQVNFIIDGNLGSPVSGTFVAGAPAGSKWYRLYTPLAAGEHAINAQLKIGPNWYDMAPTATAYSLDIPWFDYQNPQVGTYYRPSDGYARISIDDEFMQFKNATFAVYTSANVLVGNYTVNRADCDLREAGTRVICDLTRDYAGVLPSLTNGDYYMKLQTSDYAGGGVRFTHANSQSVNFTIDSESPVVSSIASVGVGPIFTNNFEVAVAATDNYGLASVDVYYTGKRFDGQCDPSQPKIDSKTVLLPDVVDGKYHATFDTSALTGDYCFFAVAEDLANSHNNPQQGKQMFTFDNTAPATPTGLKFLSADRSQQFSCAQHITVQNTISDWDDVIGDASFDHYEYSALDANGVLLDKQSVAVSEWSNSWIPATDGTYGFAVRSVDLAGNKSAWAVSDETLAGSCQIVYDSTAPSVDLVFPIPGPSATSFQAVFSEDVNVTDAQNPANYFLNNWPGAGSSGDLVGDATVSYDAPTRTATVSFSKPAWYVSPEQEWGVQNIHDLAGNLQVANPYSEYSTPMEAPSDPGTPATAPNPTNVLSQIWNWTASIDPNAGSDVKGYYQQVYDVATSSVFSAWSWLGNVLGVTTNLADGQWQLQLKAEDNAGNQSGVVSSATVTVDTVVPTATISYDIITPTNTDVVATLNPSETVTITNYGSASYTFTANGSFTFQFVDAAGNTGSATATVTNIDKDAPSVPVDPSHNNVAIPTNDFDFAWGASSDISLPITYEFQSSLNPASVGGVLTTGLWSSGVLTSNTIHSSGAPDGTWYWQVRAIDAVGNKSAWSEIWNVTLDHVFPTVTVDSLLTKDNTPALSGTWTENYQLDRIEVVVDGQVALLATINGDGTWSLADDTLTALADGVYDVQVTAFDKAGNQANDSTSSELEIDSTNPVVSVAINPASPDGLNGWYVTQPEITLSVVDVNPDVLEYQWDSNSGAWSAYVSSLKPTTEGTHTLYYRAFDQLGNASGEGSLELKWDETAPTLTSQTEFDGWFTSNPTSYFNFADNLSSSPLLGEPVSCEISTEGTAQTCTVAPNVCDEAGNCYTSLLTSNEANLDKTMPKSTITAPFNSGTGSVIYTNAWDGTISGTATDLLSGIDQVRLSIQRESDGKFFDGEGWVDGTEATVRVTATPVVETDDWNYLLTGPTEDTYQITSHAVDVAGNVENSYELTIVFDKTIPEVSLSISPVNPDGKNGWYYTRPTVTLTMTDNKLTDHIEYQWDAKADGAWVTYSSPIQPASEGRHVLYYRAMDKAGNYSEVGVKNIAWDQTELTQGPLKVDATPDRSAGPNAKVTWEAATDNVGVDHYKINFDLIDGNADFSVDVASHIREVTTDRLKEEGKWKITVTAYDGAGHEKSASDEILVDKTAPVAPVLSTTGNGAGFVDLAWTKVADAKEYIILYGVKDGQYIYAARVGNVLNYKVQGLTAGNYFFVVRAEDEAGNQSANSNQVSVPRLLAAPNGGNPVAEGFNQAGDVLGAKTEDKTEEIAPIVTSESKPASGEVQGVTENACKSWTNSLWWLLLLVQFVSLFALEYRLGKKQQWLRLGLYALLTIAPVVVTYYLVNKDCVAGAVAWVLRYYYLFALAAAGLAKLASYLLIEDAEA